MEKLARYHISGLKFHAFVGLYAEEQQNGNDFEVDVWYSAPYMTAAVSDHISDTVNYADMFAALEEVFQHRCNLVEQIAQKAVSSLKGKFPSIVDLTVRVKKLNPPVSVQVEGVSITVNG